MRRRTSLFVSLGLLSASLLMLSGCGEPEPVPYKVTLEVWGTFDDSDAFNTVIAEYKKINPYIKEVNYRKLSPETYKEDLLDAMAAGTGPDIFMLRNTWLSNFADKSVPAPTNLFNEKIVREQFVDVVAEDFLNSGTKELYAVPLSVDSLALYYNKDIFNAAGISTPPKTWEEIVELVPKLTKVDEFGNINQSAIALGTADNVNRSSDILLTLMMQFGSDISDRSFRDQSDQQALDFYTLFARLGGPVYTWNQRQHYSIDAFYEGTLGMMLNYSYHYPTIKQKNAKLNFAVTPMPVFKDKAPVNFANYWGFAVAKNKTQPPADPSEKSVLLSAESYQKVRVHESWQLLSFLTLPHPGNTVTLQNALAGTVATFPIAFDPAKKYLEMTRKPAARRDILNLQKSDLVLDSFTTGNLVAKSWRPSNTEAAETLLTDAISSVVRGERGARDALGIFENRFGR